MGDRRTHIRSFGGGEVTPEFFGRIDDSKYQTGLSICRNFIVQPHGPVSNRPGTRFVRAVKDSTKRTRTLPFIYAFDQSVLIEFAEGAFRFHALGQTVMHPAAPAWVTATAYVQGDLVSDGGGTYYAIDAHTSGGTFGGDAAHWYQLPADGVYEVPHPYLEAELFAVAYAQSGDVLTLVHPNHPPRELRRQGATNWVLTEIAFVPLLSPPGGVNGSGTPGDTPGTPFDTDYVVTALTGTEDESLQSSTATISNNLYDDGAYNTINWNAVTGAVRYNIFKRAAGLFGFIGQTDQLTFRDDNIAPDLGRTPPLDIDVMGSAGDYPGAVTYNEQRRVFAGSINEPQNVWMSRAGTESNMNYSIPPLDNDSIQFKMASREANGIRHLVPMTDLIALTPAAVWRIFGGASDVITPITLVSRQQSFVGASATKPALVGNNMVYVAARGGHLRELGFDGERGGFISGDVSVRAPHLFDNRTITTLTVSQAPYPVVWCVSTNGLLIGFTYIPEQQVGAFHWHDTQGAFEDATTIHEDGRDVTYVVVRREIDGQQVRYIEFFTDRLFDDYTEQHFVDCGAVYDGTPTNTVAGLDWLEGATVSILADGAVCPQQVVLGGEVSLPDAVEASVIHIGLPYVSDLRTLPMAVELEGYGQGMPKNVNAVWMRVYRSSGIFAGPSFDELVEYKQRTIEPMGSPPELKSEEIEIVVQGAWTDDGAVCIRQSDPLALTVLSLTADFALGGG